MSTNRLFIPIVMIASVVLIAVRSLGLAMSPRTEAKGNFVMASTTIYSVMEDKFNETIDISTTLTYTGTLEGTSTLQGTLTVHPDDSTSFLGREVFTGSVNGIPGTLTFKVTGRSEPYQSMLLTNTIMSGTSGLTSLQGAISMTFVMTDHGRAGLYEGQINHE